MDGAWVYILRCADGAYYVGSTRASLEQRVGQHNTGIAGSYTISRRPVDLVYSQWFERITDAVTAERQVKRWRRAKKEALIAGCFDLLPVLSKRPGAARRFLAHPSRPPSAAPQDEDSLL